MNLYVSNLPYSTSDDDLMAAFAAYGTVSSARVMMDRETGRPRGFAFVEMPAETEALAAMHGLNGSELEGRQIRIVEARPREERPPRRDFGGGGGGGNKGASPVRKQPDYDDEEDHGRGRRDRHRHDDRGWDRHKCS